MTRPSIDMGIGRAAIIALAVLAATAGSAAAACPETASTQAFARWGDTAYYSPMPNGGFEQGTSGWQPFGATLVADQDPYGVGGTGTKAIELASSWTKLTSPTICIDTIHPHFRFMVKGASAGVLITYFEYLDYAGTWRSAAAKVQQLSASGWQPSGINPLATAIPGLIAGKPVQVRLKWIAVGGAARIDNVMVDPYRRR